MLSGLSDLAPITPSSLPLGAVWWIKRDLRVFDNPALTEAVARAAASGLPLLPLFLFEPSVLSAPETSPFHIQAQRQALEDLRRHMGETEAEIQSLDGITLAVEVWLGKEAQKKEARERERCKESGPDEKEDALPLLSRAHAGTPGAAYLAEFLPGVTDYYDADWLAESINNGTLLICPRCHFLRLQSRPFPLDPILIRRLEAGEQPAPVDGCDVCALLPEACHLPIVPVYVEKALKGAAADLVEQREKRAQLLYALWEGPVNAADALLWDRMGQALEDVRNLPQKQGE